MDLQRDRLCPLPICYTYYIDISYTIVPSDMLVSSDYLQAYFKSGVIYSLSMNMSRVVYVYFTVFCLRQHKRDKYFESRFFTICKSLAPPPHPPRQVRSQMA